MPKLLTQYRVFIGSPSGLDEERKCFRCTLTRYTALHSEPRGVAFRPVGWEDTLGGVGRPQDIINEDLKRCDFVVFVLHDHWGSPTGSGYTSGVEEEFAIASELYNANQIRQIALFFKQVDPRQIADPGKQLEMVLAFKQRILAGKQHLFRQYETTDQFMRVLEAYLAQWERDHEGKASSLSLGRIAPDAVALPDVTLPGFDYWIIEALRQLRADVRDYGGAMFCAQKAMGAASSTLNGQPQKISVA